VGHGCRTSPFRRDVIRNFAGYHLGESVHEGQALHLWQRLPSVAVAQEQREINRVSCPSLLRWLKDPAAVLPCCLGEGRRLATACNRPASATRLPPICGNGKGKAKGK
jgi:hypothetical protein